MTYEQRAEMLEHEQMLEAQGEQYPAVLIELVKVLAAHPSGFRRWSVMRAIRTEREHLGKEVPQKLEDEVERTFRRYCADAKNGDAPAEDALFYRPREKAGEVWAAYPERIKPLLANNDNEVR